MRLLNVDDLRLTEFIAGDIPDYAIVSHRWESDEITFQDLEAEKLPRKRGLRKVREACHLAREDRHRWIWIDTCCIDKRNAVELNEAINAMYKWYQNAKVCYAYLFDHVQGSTYLEDSTWFKRCWTLQELIAPFSVMFFDRDWSFIGSKDKLAAEISSITRISIDILRGADCRECSIAQRMSWAADREATRVEDEAYSLLGIFGLSLPTLYGSGTDAFRELQEKLLQRDDLSILAWDKPMGREGTSKFRGLLARSPADFALCHNTRLTQSLLRSNSQVGQGVEIDVPTVPYTLNVYICLLGCTSGTDNVRDAILLQKLTTGQGYKRLMSNEGSVHQIRASMRSSPECVQRTMYVPHEIHDRPSDLAPGFWVRRLQLPGYDSRDHESVRVCSRLDGKVNFSRPHGSIVRLPDDEWGTTGIIYVPVGSSSGRSHLIRWIKLGFNAESRPVIRLGNGRSKAMTLYRAATRYATSDDFEWDNTWLTDKLTVVHKGTGKEYDSEEYFHHRTFEQVEAADDNNFRTHIKHLKLNIKLSIEVISPLAKFVHVPQMPSRSSYTKIWTLEITDSGTYASANQYLAATVAAAGALGLMGHSIREAHHAYKAAEERQQRLEEARRHSRLYPRHTWLQQDADLEHRRNETKHSGYVSRAYFAVRDLYAGR